MKESIRTLSFVGVALVAAALAWFVSAGSAPAEAEAFAKVGDAFYPEFTDPTEAGSLEIISYDEDAGRVRKFQVELDRGRWRIPSHHGYPADAKDQLEKVAASLIGITRQALAGRRANAHERFGVVQPPETSTVDEDEALEGLGQRIVLKDKAGNVLADYILGKRVAGQDNMYFVRTPDEDDTYRAEIELDVSTKFGDWVEKDLLKLDRNNLLSIELKTPKFEMVQTPLGPAKAIVGENSLAVHRDETGPGSDWKIDGLDAKTEEIDTSGVSGIQTGLDSLELLGVRPKPQGITADLTLDLERFSKDRHPQEQLNELRDDLNARGFELAMLRRDQGQQSQPKLLLFGEGGELIAKTNEGLVYHIHFGKEFLGTQQDIEVGKTELADEEGKKVEDDEKSDAEGTGKSKTTLSRYLFIRVELDESLLGEAPKKPEEPQKPEGLKEEQPAKQAPQDEKKEKTPEELKQEELKREYDSKMALYRNELAAYEEDNKEYQEKRKAGKAKADELNSRFREWYYVIPASSYENLTFTRDDVVKAKGQEEPKTETPSATTNPQSSTLRRTLSDLENLVKGGAKAGDAPKPAIAEKPEAETEPAKPDEAGTKED